ncbi:hypothetical protein [Serratia quinivorans]|uniref:hypothetical protein n=1 Tax=Serratia quinivorans TaxID=137545 RepID=UPI00217AC9CB|nr:hypothetical protein [Serratia quinivorans]CAI1107374.1 Uncharacterised protein [Serratia quinivorans]
MSILKPAKILGAGSGEGSVTVEDITDASTLGKSLLKAEDGDAARRQIAAMGTEGDQVIRGSLELKSMLTVNLPQPVADNRIPVINLPWKDGTVGAYIDYAHNAQDEVSLGLNVRQAKGKEKRIWQIVPTDNGLGQVGGFEIVEESYLKVGGQYYLNLVTDTGYGVLTAKDEETARAAIQAMGHTGDQVLDGKLQLNHQLVLKSVQQTDANVIAFYFGEDDGVVDVAIKATGTADNHGQIAISVRDDSGNLINAITVDGNSKAVLFQPGYKIYIGNSAVDISNITSFGGQLIACQDKAAARQLLGITE